MKAMVLAAGLGTRLRPLTDARPKALVTIAGRTLLEMTLSRLRAFGVREVIVNVHHHAEMIVDYLKANHNFGMRIEVSREEVLLDTGGGLKKAAWFFLEAGASATSAEPIDAPFLVHNVDVLSNIDLAGMVRFHAEHNALATLAVQDRETSRYLLFNEQGQLCGRRAGRDAEPELARPVQPVEALAFSGIHVLSPRISSMFQDEGAFSIINAYLRLAAQGEKILAFRADGSYWRDLGRPENLIEAARDVESGTYRES
jgi:NDP-sugar pyrophosphorylase family protein